MLRILKLFFFLVVIVAIVVVGFAYFGDLSPDQQDVSQPVDLATE